MSRDLLARWQRTCVDAGTTAPPHHVAAAGVELLCRWAEPHRRYHDVTHLADVLQHLDELTADGAPAASDAAVHLAAWFHDAVHDGVAGVDERASADVARHVLGGLGLPPGQVARVGRLVLATSDHAAGDDTGAQALCDADLAVLGAEAERYEQYRHDVREEYAAVDDATFRRGRSAVLGALADREPLFATAAGRRRWERAARRNLHAELAAL